MKVIDAVKNTAFTAAINSGLKYLEKDPEVNIPKLMSLVDKAAPEEMCIRDSYTVGLFGSIPSLTEESKRLHPIEGLMPDPTEKPAGCWFAPRCRHCTEKCKKQVPPVYLSLIHI